jgi:hypothetical protein
MRLCGFLYEFLWKSENMKKCGFLYLYLWLFIWDVSHQYIYTRYVSHFHYSPKCYMRLLGYFYEVDFCQYEILWLFVIFLVHFMRICDFTYEIFKISKFIWDITQSFIHFCGFPYEKKNDRFKGSLFAYVAQSQPSIWSRCIWYTFSYLVPQNLIFEAIKSHICVRKSHIFGKKRGVHCRIPKRINLRFVFSIVSI